MPDDAARSGSSIGDDEQMYASDGKRKAEMTAEERTNYERERNRVHARNTRARKKQYMEELKERVESMHAQRVSPNRFFYTEDCIPVNSYFNCLVGNEYCVPLCTKCCIIYIYFSTLYYCNYQPIFLYMNL